jgi:hypothetical protein
LPRPVALAGAFEVPTGGTALTAYLTDWKLLPECALSGYMPSGCNERLL